MLRRCSISLNNIALKIIYKKLFLFLQWKCNVLYIKLYKSLFRNKNGVKPLKKKVSSFSLKCLISLIGKNSPVLSLTVIYLFLVSINLEYGFIPKIRSKLIAIHRFKFYIKVYFTRKINLYINNLRLQI